MKKDHKAINDFMNLKSFALIGASAKKKKFGNEILKQMIFRGINIYPVHRNADYIEGVKCYPNLDSLPEKPKGVILVIKPEETEKAVKEIARSGIKNVFMQQGASSKGALEFCRAKGINVIDKECILMFLEKPGFPHNIHKWIWGIGK